MQVRALHPWNVTLREAVAIQQRLRRRVITGSAGRPGRGACLARDGDSCNLLVAGADISYDKGSDRFFAAVIVGRLAPRAAFSALEIRRAVGRARFPYIPGLLSFREVPILQRAFAKLRTRPDVLLVDGQGIAHPRRFGIACHLGLLLDLPTIGCAKSRLLGQYRQPRARRGSLSDLLAASRSRSETTPRRGGRCEILGRVVRTQDGIRPLFVSVGHKIDLDNAVRVVLACCGRCRLPEPTRQAHIEVNRMRRSALGTDGKRQK